MKPKVFRWVLAVDLDRCLLNRRGELSCSNSAALSLAHARGAAIVVATGRMKRATEHVASQMPPIIGLVLLNGALVIDCVAGHTVFESSLTSDVAEAIFAWCTRHECRAVLCGSDAVSFAEPDHVVDEYLRRTGAIAEVRRTPWTTDWPYYKALIYKFPSRQVVESDVARSFASTAGLSAISLCKTGFGYVEIMATGVAKEHGLWLLLTEMQLINLPLVAIGDGEGDVGMLRMTRNSYAVANACVEARSAAVHLVDDCDADGVAKAIKHFISSS